jgi:NADH dehydrogenase FAD-containing subunit
VSEVKPYSAIFMHIGSLDYQPQLVNTISNAGNKTPAGGPERYRGFAEFRDGLGFANRSRREEWERLVAQRLGGGPTGVELAGTIAELAHENLREDFRHIDTRKARIILIEAGPRIHLPSR